MPPRKIIRLKKARGEAKLKSLLTDEQQLQLCDWLPHMTQRKALALIEKEFGIKSSTRALTDFWDSVYTPLQLAERERANQTATALTEDIAKSPGQWDAPILDKIKESAYRILSTCNDPDDVVKLTSLFLETRNQDIKKEALADAREKFKAALMKKIDLGLEELYSQIKDNPAALEAFNKMKAAIGETK